MTVAMDRNVNVDDDNGNNDNNDNTTRGELLNVSVSSDDNNSNSSRLTLVQGIALLTADCMGVGILGLPNDMKVIGFSIGICFLLLNCPINYYAGNLLAIVASNIEENENGENESENGEDDGREERDDNDNDSDNDNDNDNDNKERDHQGDDDENDGIIMIATTTSTTTTKEIELTNTTNTNMNMNMNTNVDKTIRRIKLFSNNNNNHNNNKRRNNWKRQRQRRQSYKGLPLEQQEQEENEDQVNKKHKEYYNDNDDGSGHRSNERLNIDGDDDNDDIDDDIFQDEIVVIQDNSNDQDYYNENDINSEDDDNNDDNDKSRKAKTSDLINITEVVFSDYQNDNSSTIDVYYIIVVKILYYTNLFLVLGDYILVMGKSVMAVFGDISASDSDSSGDKNDNSNSNNNNNNSNNNFILCLPIASFIASILMFGLCQFRTMANIGKHMSMLSLLALFIVLLQCLFHHHYYNSRNDSIEDDDVMMEEQEDITTTTTMSSSSWKNKFSSLAGIGFAVGSNKLFLNIRNELNDRSQGSKVLAGSLTLYGFVYIIVILLAGSDPPSFLFDSIGDGYSRRIAGLLLWFHVAVSYAINSQALCKSIDGIITAHQRRRGIRNTRSNNNNNNNSNNNFLSRIIRSNNNVIDNPIHRWLCITLVVTISSYLVSNAIPFFKDLVGLIGALTSVPLCLSLPAILYRKYAKSKSKSKSNAAAITATSIIDESKSNNSAAAEVAVYQVQQSINNNDITNICRRFWSYCCSYSYLLLLYSFLFLIIGLIGSISSIEEDWLNQGKPFSCQ